MLYDYNTSLKITLRIYEYLQVRATKVQPRTIKMNKPLHCSMVISFLEMLPPSAGADFIWDFLLFQFNVYASQEHGLKPMPGWFMGKEAWKRWREYSEEAKWHAKEWAREKGLKNPVSRTEYEPVSQEVFRKERLKMSRISGPNFCAAKFGDNPYNEEDDICFTCPFKKDCEMLFTSDKNGKNLYQKVSEVEMSDEELKQLNGTHVTVRDISRMAEYGEEDGSISEL